MYSSPDGVTGTLVRNDTVPMATVNVGLPVSSHTTTAGAELLRRWTRAHLDQQLGIFVDGRLISAPVIKSSIGEMIAAEAASEMTGVLPSDGHCACASNEMM